MTDASSFPSPDEIGTGVQNLLLILASIVAGILAVKRWWAARKGDRPRVAADRFAATAPPTPDPAVIAVRGEVEKLREEHGRQLEQLFSDLSGLRAVNAALARRTHALEHAWPDGHRKPWIDQQDALLIRDWLDDDTIEATAGRSRFAPPDPE